MDSVWERFMKDWQVGMQHSTGVRDTQFELQKESIVYRRFQYEISWQTVGEILILTHSSDHQHLLIGLD